MLCRDGVKQLQDMLTKNKVFIDKSEIDKSILDKDYISGLCYIWCVDDGIMYSLDDWIYWLDRYDGVEYLKKLITKLKGLKELVHIDNASGIRVETVDNSLLREYGIVTEFDRRAVLFTVNFTDNEDITVKSLANSLYTVGEFIEKGLWKDVRKGEV